MQHSVSIKEVTTIRLGNTFRGKIESNDRGEIAVIQPKNIENAKLKEPPAFISPTQVSSLNKHLLQPGDILLSNKGLKFASLLYERVPDQAIASSSFFVLVPKTDLILPKYLTWYLNQGSAINDLLKLVSVSTVPSLSKSALERFKIPLPDLETQHKIAELTNLISEERKELESLIAMRQEYQDAYCWELILTSS